MTQGLDGAIRRGIAGNLPVSVHLDLTHRCDLACVHCYLAGRQTRGLATGQYVALLDDLAQAGTLHLLVSGGEPLLRPDALELLRHARSLRFCVKLLTHGGHIDDATADSLAELGLAEVAVSLYSMRPDHHDAVTRVAGSHSRTVAAVRRLRARGVQVQVKCTVTRANEGSWDSLVPWSQSMGCDLSLEASHHGRKDGDATFSARHNIDWEHRVAVHRRVLQRDLERAGDQAWCGRSAQSLDEPLCNAGRSFCYIDAAGRVFPCARLRRLAGDVTQQPFAEIWSSSVELRRLRELTRRSAHGCADCRFLLDCHLCPGFQQEETGDLLGRSTLVCTETHARFAAARSLGLFDGEILPPRDGVGVRGCRCGAQAPPST